MRFLCRRSSRRLLTPCSDVSRTSNVSVSAYLRTAQSVRGKEDMGNDILMARVDLTPVLDGHVSEAYRLTPFSSSMLTDPRRPTSILGSLHFPNV